MNDVRGSKWRKWDLHFHTPSSFDYQNKSITNSEIIEMLEAKEIKAVAITDHHVMDIHRIEELQRLGKEKGITVFPGIELRSELGGSESIHFIGIFPEDSDVGDISVKIQGKLEITSADIKRKGDDFVYCDFKESSKVIHELGGIVTVHAGKKTNGIESIRNNHKYKQAIKKDLVEGGYIDVFEVGQLDDVTSYQEMVFPHLGKSFPLIICSDNHLIREYHTKASLWIKADLTYKGLKQAITESKDRIKLGIKPEQIVNYETKKTKIIDSISVKEINDKLTGTWFDKCEVKFNSGLVSIIGNKGNGKSALVDILGLLGGSSHNSFEFLNDKKFRNSKNNISQHFEATLRWASEDTSTKKLSENVLDTEMERVKYIPQQYLEKLCNEMNIASGNSFDAEIKKVIFSHISIENRLGCETFDQLLNLKTKELSEEMNIYRRQVSEVNSSICEIEFKLTSNYREQINEQLKAKQIEYDQHLKMMPEKVEKPLSDNQAESGYTELTKEVSLLNNQKAQLQDDRYKKIEERKFLVKKQEAVKSTLGKIDNFMLQFDKLSKDLGEHLELLGISQEQVISFKVNKFTLLSNQEEINEKLDVLAKYLDGNSGGSYNIVYGLLDEKLSQLEDKLDRPNKLYQEYLGKIEEWNKVEKELMGDTFTPNSLSYIQNQLNELDSALPNKLVEAKEFRKQLSNQIFDLIQNLISTYQDLYNPVQNAISAHHLIREKYQLNFEVSIVLSSFVEDFFQRVGNSRGSFYGAEDGTRRLKEIIDRYEFLDFKSIISFIDEVLLNLETDQRDSSKASIPVELQLRKGMTKQELYDFLFNLSYLSPIYALKLGDKEIDKLSPGEKGALLLMFYLLVDRDDRPLIIDQPEENLDNQSVFELLVPCIKEAKNRRQIFIVTHNPNLAVVCDAEQVIYSSIDKKNANKVNYLTGSIENIEVNNKIVDILEGTWPAFDNRTSKYIMVV
ncbi:TrlF family AAA-like ATPase [Paenibacillus sp. IHBB 10380]|uniref:TrlF family AAA-like ATPase n=1 Tax=Paenibacillus sp. IHBB 10380 TaxID=1566358 RepID=UPI000696A84C|nr:AAA family ATPase [Paenibacillus sp. IHBB 10380]